MLFQLLLILAVVLFAFLFFSTPTRQRGLFDTDLVAGGIFTPPPITGPAIDSSDWWKPGTYKPIKSDCDLNVSITLNPFIKGKNRQDFSFTYNAGIPGEIKRDLQLKARDDYWVWENLNDPGAVISVKKDGVSLVISPSWDKPCVTEYAMVKSL